MIEKRKAKSVVRWEFDVLAWDDRHDRASAVLMATVRVTQHPRDIWRTMGEFYGVSPLRHVTTAPTRSAKRSG